MTQATFAPAAVRDLAEAMGWIAGDNPAAARALRDGVVTAAMMIAAHPRAGRARPEIVDGPYLFFVVTGFPYVIVYNAERVPPRIVRVLHTSTGPGRPDCAR